MIEPIAKWGNPNHMKPCPWINPNMRKVQFNTLYVESKIHSHAMVPMEIGATHGRRIRKRISRLKRKSLWRVNARALLRSKITIWEIQRNTKRVLKRGLELGSADDIGEVAQPNETHCSATGGGVADAVIESHEERQPPPAAQCKGRPGR